MRSTSHHDQELHRKCHGCTGVGYFQKLAFHVSCGMFCDGMSRAGGLSNAVMLTRERLYIRGWHGTAARYQGGCPQDCWERLPSILEAIQIRGSLPGEMRWGTRILVRRVGSCFAAVQ